MADRLRLAFSVCGVALGLLALVAIVPLYMDLLRSVPTVRAITNLFWFIAGFVILLVQAWRSPLGTSSGLRAVSVLTFVFLTGLGFVAFIVAPSPDRDLILLAIIGLFGVLAGPVILLMAGVAWPARHSSKLRAVSAFVAGYVLTFIVLNALGYAAFIIYPSPDGGLDALLFYLSLGFSPLVGLALCRRVMRRMSQGASRKAAIRRNRPGAIDRQDARNSTHSGAT